MLKIDNRVISLNSNPLIIPEIGINHKEYAHTTKLTEDNVKSLTADFI